MLRKPTLLLAFGIFLIGACANLIWVEPKIYMPGSTEIEVEGHGINGPVDILPRGTTAITISHEITNAGNSPVPAGYQITETVIQWVFQRNIASVGWREGDPATHTIVQLSQSGPALDPGESAVISFGPFTVGSCGLFGETLELDSTNIVVESSNQDNEDKHLFFVPSNQIINITANTINGTLYHKDGRTLTHQFRINSGGAGNQWLYTGFSWIATEGSTADAVPAPTGRVPQGPAPQLINMFVTPKDHDHSPLGFGPSVKGKVTAISTDGCVVKQKAVEVLVEHD
ncbi:hypothetical protein SAMN05444358_105199 [Ruegeria halocynthiae]|uniref:Uncharacterized protein n=1 Tax=Ruegeria halocynthiae TaxID=985054 RepID=A0A1H3BIJ4_9RHOB|nr:hypothetical protein [Ruegeria halocynthiae]SDX41763.1 hypothetical protein SAMN05444358_105199 [Ruegeria halocynthiae]